MSVGHSLAASFICCPSSTSILAKKKKSAPSGRSTIGPMAWPLSVYPIAARRGAAVVGVGRAEVDAQPVALAAALAVGDGGGRACARAPPCRSTCGPPPRRWWAASRGGRRRRRAGEAHLEPLELELGAPGPPARILPLEDDQRVAVPRRLPQVPAAASHATTALSHEPRPGALHTEEHARLEHQLHRAAHAAERHRLAQGAARARDVVDQRRRQHQQRRRLRLLEEHRRRAPRRRVHVVAVRAAHQLDARVLEHRESRAATAFDVLVAMARASATDGAERRMSGSIGVPSISSRISGCPAAATSGAARENKRTRQRRRRRPGVDLPHRREPGLAARADLEHFDRCPPPSGRAPRSGSPAATGGRREAENRQVTAPCLPCGHFLPLSRAQHFSIAARACTRRTRRSLLYFSLSSRS